MMDQQTCYVDSSEQNDSKANESSSLRTPPAKRIRVDNSPQIAASSDHN